MDSEKGSSRTCFFCLYAKSPRLYAKTNEKFWSLLYAFYPLHLLVIYLLQLSLLS